MATSKGAIIGAKALPVRCTPGTIVDDGNILRTNLQIDAACI
jgi:hypothetical protein